MNDKEKAAIAFIHNSEIRDPKKTIIIATHDGDFHADEVLGVALIIIAFPNFRIIVLRTRDPEIYEKAHFILDQSCKFDDSKYFDHHQGAGIWPGKREIKKATAGLVWDFLKKKITNEKNLQKMIENKFIKWIDAYDNHQGRSEFSELIKEFNILDSEDMLLSNDRFKEAVFCAMGVFKRKLSKYKNIVDKENQIREIVESRENKEYVVMEEGVHPEIWRGIVPEFEDLIFVVYKDNSNNWRAEIIEDIDESGIPQKRSKFPILWAGKEGVLLEETTRINGAIFCHSNLFMFKAKTKEAIIEAINIVLKAK